MTRSGLVSVVIPTYFRNDDLRRAIQSALKQTYEPVEVIVVDDSGERHAKEVVAEFPEVDYRSMEENRGPQRARIVGLEAADGEFIQFLDDDDSLAAEKLERQAPVLESNEDVGVVYCGIRWEDGPTVYPKADVRGDVLVDALRFDTSPCMMGTMLITRDVLDPASMAKHTHGADDIGLKIELARATRFEYVDEALVTRGNSVNSLGTSWDAVEGRFRVIEAYADLYDQFPASVRREALAETCLLKGERQLRDRLWSPSAIGSFAQAAVHAPGFDPVYVGSFLSSLFGRPGYGLVRSAYSWRILGPNRRGKTT